MALRHVMLVSMALCVTRPVPTHAQQACTSEQGQHFIDEGRYKQAIKEFTCVIDAQPTEAEGYRGRAEAQLLLGRYSDAMRDYGLVTAFVVPVHPDAVEVIFAGYDARLAADPQSITALTGASFARWWDFQYGKAVHLLDRLLAFYPDNVYGVLFRGSSRLLHGATTQGVADLERALALAPPSPDVHWIVADAFTYGLPDPQRAFVEATAALEGGLDTPRVHAILGASYLAFDNTLEAAQHIKRHIDLVTTALVPTLPMEAGDSFALAVVPGRVYEIPIPAVAGETISITTSSKDYWDTIGVILAPDGTPVIGSDDTNGYFAAFDWQAAQTATYRLRVTFFDAVNTGVLKVTRD